MLTIYFLNRKYLRFENVQIYKNKMFTLNESIHGCGDSLRNLIKCGSIANKCWCISINNTM